MRLERVSCRCACADSCNDDSLSRRSKLFATIEDVQIEGVYERDIPHGCAESLTFIPIRKAYSGFDAHSEEYKRRKSSPLASHAPAPPALPLSLPARFSAVSRIVASFFPIRWPVPLRLILSRRSLQYFAPPPPPSLVICSRV